MYDTVPVVAIVMTPDCAPLGPDKLICPPATAVPIGLNMTAAIPLTAILFLTVGRTTIALAVVSQPAPEALHISQPLVAQLVLAEQSVPVLFAAQIATRTLLFIASLRAVLKSFSNMPRKLFILFKLTKLIRSGTAMVAMIAAIAITISTSIKENPRCRL